MIKEIGQNKRFGNYLVLQDAYGNRFTYAELGGVVDVHPVPKPRKLTASDFELVSPPEDSAPDGQAADGNVANADKAEDAAAEKVARNAAQPIAEDESDVRRAAKTSAGPVNTEDMRPRLYALPERPEVRDRASLGGQLDDLAGRRLPGYVTFKNYFNDVFGFNRKTTELRPLREGSKVIAGTVLGRMAASKDGIAPHMHFMIRPSGRGAPAIDPKPILDGWKLLEATAIYRAAGEDPFANSVGVGAILLMSKEQLISRVLSDPRLEIYSCGRTDIRSGQINRRILALLEYLAEKGFRLTITSLTCGHGFLTASGNVSNHSSGNAVDIATINGIPVLGNQGPGTLTEALLKTVLGLQGTMVPDELISLDGLRRTELPARRPRRPRPRRLQPRLRRPGRPAVRAAAQAGPVGAPDRPPRRDRQPRRPRRPLEVLGAHEASSGKGRQGQGRGRRAQARLRRPYRRVAPPAIRAVPRRGPAAIAAP